MTNENSTPNPHQEGTPKALYDYPNPLAERESFPIDDDLFDQLQMLFPNLEMEEYLQLLKRFYEQRHKNKYKWLSPGEPNPLAVQKWTSKEILEALGMEHIPPRETEPPAAAILPLREWVGEDLKPFWLDPCEEYKPKPFTLSYNGIPFAPIDDICGLTGQPGNGKTFTFTILIAAILKGEYCGIQYELADTIPNPSVLYIDTEMAKGDTQLVQRRIYEIMEWPQQTQQEQFKILRLREVTTVAERWRKVIKAIDEMRPTVVFLDGALDVIEDFNNPTECSDRTYQFMKIASDYHLCLWCLLHENPGSEKMVGHAGSFLERKGATILKTQKDKSQTPIQYIVTQLKARHKMIEDWAFIITDGANGYGVPEPVEKPVTCSNQVPIEKVEAYLRQASTILSFPATATEVKDALRVVSKVRDNNKLAIMLKQAKNRRFLIEQTEEEWRGQKNGQKQAKLKLNLDSEPQPLLAPSEATPEEEAPF